ncbi:MAG: sigma-54-dependent Fis family transcriptional regulator [Acidobacteria bacterium]|nr:sigma-54-dependent Fis family transcriptional regulator [Acidobacteriota bacterium]MBI3427574.1 sigma-54-dependent Fis family transcriptional regulator [Acidobacteriota bacterium]
MTAEMAVQKMVSPLPRAPLSLVTQPRVVELDNYECFTGISQNVMDLKQFISVQASQQQPVLLIGERGLRQEQIARALHNASANWSKPFFAVNAHGLSGDALHELLFNANGHPNRQAGMLETVKQGTVFINELTSLTPLLQQRFAVYLEEQRWRKHASLIEQRLIFASECNPEERTADNRIAYGLVELLRSYSFALKPLRQRSEDVPYLARHLAGRIAKKLGKGPAEISPAALRVLMEYEWKHNIDELEAVLESALSNLPPQQVAEEFLPSHIRFAKLRSIPPDGIELPSLVDDFERSLIVTALQQSGNSQTKASKLLGLRVQTLNMKLKRFAEQGRPLL